MSRRPPLLLLMLPPLLLLMLLPFPRQQKKKKARFQRATLKLAEVRAKGQSSLMPRHLTRSRCRCEPPLLPRAGGCAHSLCRHRVPRNRLQKHKQGKVALVKRTAKNQRREAHRQKMAEAAKLVHGDAVMTPADAGGAKLSRQEKRQQRRSKGKAAAAAAEPAAGDGDAEVMQD